MSDDQNGDTNAGRPRRVTDEEILHAVRRAIEEQAAPIATTTDIEKRVSLSRRGLQKRLRTLREQGTLASRTVGSGRVWWVPEQ